MQQHEVKQDKEAEELLELLADALDRRKRVRDVDVGGAMPHQEAAYRQAVSCFWDCLNRLVHDKISEAISGMMPRTILPPEEEDLK
jgi:hypothetical protein